MTRDEWLEHARGGAGVLTEEELLRLWADAFFAGKKATIQAAKDHFRQIDLPYAAKELEFIVVRPADSEPNVARKAS